MQRTLWLAAVLLALAVGASAVFAAEYKGAPGPTAVEVLRGEWHDTKRNDRTVPYKVYYGRDATGISPVVLFSHGLGGTREGAAYLLEHLASHGYIVIAVQHPGSDNSVFEDGVSVAAARNAAADLRAARDRFTDIPFVIDQLATLNADGPLKGRLNLEHIGMSGHSYGAVSTMVAAGQKMGAGAMSFADARIDAAIAYSPAPAGGSLRAPDPGTLARAYENIRIPIFHMTGTADASPLRDMDPKERRIPFDTITTADEYLMVLQGGDHMVFSGRRRDAEKATDARQHDLIRMASIAFWDAELRGDAKARAWLDDGGLTQELGSDGTFEMKRVGG